MNHPPQARAALRSRGFTLVEMVVALTLATIVVGFAGMLLTTPLDQYAQQAQRATLVDSARAAWPQMRDDLRSALPNSARARRNGSVVVLEMLATVDWVRYRTPLNTLPIKTAGTFRDVTAPFTSTKHYLSVNNLGSGAPGADAYALSGSMTGAGAQIDISDEVSPTNGEWVITINAPLAFTADSPKHRLYLVTGPVTYLCDETAGTLRRYANYSIAANQPARDTAGELMAAGATAPRLLAQGITSCNFTAGPGSTTAAQIVTVNITAASGNDSIQLIEQAAVENLP